MTPSLSTRLPRWPFLIAAAGFGLIALAAAALLYFGPASDLWRLYFP
jgi:hypothetical protein